VDTKVRAHGQGFDALAVAHKPVAKMSGDIAAAIRGEAEQKSEGIKS
jgi:hypothetical protein